MHSSPHRRALIVGITAWNLLALAALGYGLVLMLEEPSKSPVLLFISAAAIAGSLICVRFAMPTWTVWLVVCANVLLGLVYFSVLVLALAKDAIADPPGNAYWAFVAATHAVSALGAGRLRPNNSFKPKPLRGSA